MKKSNSFGRLFSYMKGNRARAVIAVLIALVSTTLFVLTPKILGQVTDLLTKGVQTGSFDVNAIVATIAVMVAFYIVSQGLAIIQNFIFARISAKMVEKLRDDVDAKMHCLKLNYYDTHTNGEILSTITNDVEMVNQLLSQDINQAIPQIFQALGFIIMAFTINVWLALITLAIVPVSLLVSKGVIAASAKQYAEQQNLLSDLNGVIEENYGGQYVVQAFNYQDRAIKSFSNVNDKLQDVAYKATQSAGLVRPLTTVVNNAGYILGAVIGCTMAIAGAVTVGDVQAILQYTQQLSGPFQTISGMAGDFASASAASKRIFAFLDDEEEIPNPENPIVPKTNKGAVEFEHVEFGYVPGKTLMNDVSISVKPGQKVAVVGPTGAGKTTLINLLMRFYEIDGGKIIVDGVDTREMTREELRRRFGMVLQDTWLFEGTIMDNLKYGGDNISDETVYEASKAANTDRFIRTLPGGYDMVLDEGAENISQGERQMLTIARAMATSPEIMILDEATSNVDTHTEVLIQEAMGKLMQGRTSFVIAHRLSTIKDSNMILYMENGDIKEAGNHDELMALNGKYASLYNSQFQ